MRARGIHPPSYKTYCKAIKKRKGYEQTLKRKGRRAAYQEKVPYLYLDQTTPRHGDFPWHISHLDHFQPDIQLVSSRTGKVLGKPWATVMSDANCRRIPAVYLSFDPPSHRVEYDIKFLMQTLPTSNRGEKLRVQYRKGVQVHYEFYWSKKFADGDVVGTEVAVRIDPFDISHVFAFVKGEWTQCDAESRDILQAIDVCYAAQFSLFQAPLLPSSPNEDEEDDDENVVDDAEIYGDYE